MLRLVAIACALTLVASGAWADDWLTVHGFRDAPEDDLAEVNPTPQDEGRQLTVLLRVSRKEMRTSFKGNRYRSYLGKAAIDCSTQTGWYLSNRYYQQPLWKGAVTAEESFRPGEAPVAFKDMPGDAARKIVHAACKIKPKS
ncbi:MAG: hypothetical protein EOP24_32750 [Hyphomicrobiales bacterium]|nr:MAG: hypothetical protein EOP24_32750 [Hyphomicrobiales bacterium]